jgi:zinc/manganese transport system substrate-binding protein
MKARAVAGLGLAAFVAISGACAADNAEADGPTVIATTSVLGDVTSELVADAGRVETLIPRGTDPHEYQASAAQAAEVRQADLVVANGLGLEEGLASVLDAATAAGVPVLELAPQLDPIAGDPHFWLDPLRMANGARLIGQELAAQVADDGWLDRAKDYAIRLESIHDEVDEILAAVPPERRLLVTDHDSFRYFAERYDFTVLGTLIPGTSPLAAPTAQHIADLAAQIRAEEIPAIFLDVASTDTVAEALRREAGTDVTVVRLRIGSLGPEGTEAGTYAGMLLDNAQRVAETLGG